MAFDPMAVAELRIVPRNGELYAEYVYQSGNAGPTCNLDLDHQQALGIDHGLGNWLTRCCHNWQIIHYRRASP